MTKNAVRVLVTHALLLAVIAALAGCGLMQRDRQEATHASPPKTTPDRGKSAEPQREQVRAPIEQAEIVQSDDGYTLRIVSGLPSGCARFKRIEVMRADPDLFVDVWNSMPTREDIACTQVYDTTENNINLGGDFTPGQQYSIIINREIRLQLDAR